MRKALIIGLFIIGCFGIIYGYMELMTIVNPYDGKEWRELKGWQKPTSLAIIIIFITGLWFAIQLWFRVTIKKLY